MAKVIMIQGTMSNSGKSFLAAALCRIFRQDGYKAAPFKSQNMALNSFITREGLEMGRAQVMQAEAAGIEPSVDMNPILLKPTSHTGSQVIVGGEIRGQMSAADYFKYKKKLIPDIMAAYERLADKHDIIVVEGAGSPAEINLKENDIVNMGLADMLDAPVLLAGDIDRGGVFASLYGTVKLLDPAEQKRIKGLVINKFRGDVDILKPGLHMIEELTHIPVVGVVPMLSVDLDDEDSLSDHLHVKEKSGEGLDVAVIRLPHISNFTDFTPFERLENVCLRYADKAALLQNSQRPDLILIPGSKNTMKDLLWLRENGMEAAILKANRDHHIPVVGVCGGFQMLGRSLSDPEGVEAGGQMAGMGLLDMETVFKGEKTRSRIQGKVLQSAGLFQKLEGHGVSGYEIHMGISRPGKDAFPMIRLDDGRIDAMGDRASNVWGTYLHGIFDDPDFLKDFLEPMMVKKHLSYQDNGLSLQAYKEIQYDKLAEGVRQALDMETIYRILEMDGKKREE